MRFNPNSGNWEKDDEDYAEEKRRWDEGTRRLQVHEVEGARHLTCAVCAGDAGRWRQHWNRDTGFGICRACADWMATRETAEDLARLYGTAGVNYAPAELPAADTEET